MPSVRPVPTRKAGLESSEALAIRLEELERKIERLRSLYESFFLGVDRRPPNVPRQELNRLMVETQQLSIRNAAMRFKFQSLAQRWTLLTTYWNRTLREIEAGTYRRDLQKAYRRIAARGEPLTESEAAALGIPASRAQAFVAQQNRRSGLTSSPNQPVPSPVIAPRTLPAPATNGAPPDGGKATATTAAAAIATTATTAPIPSSATAGSVEGEELAELHRAYADAHARLALPGAPPTPERLHATVRQRLERMRADNPGVRLRLAVVTDQGRIVIRAKPLR